MSDNRFCVRQTPEDERLLERISEKTGLKKSEVFRNALREYYNIVFASEQPSIAECFYSPTDGSLYEKNILSEDEVTSILFQDTALKEYKKLSPEKFIKELGSSEIAWPVLTFDGSTVKYRKATDEEITAEKKRRKEEEKILEKGAKLLFRGK